MLNKIFKLKKPNYSEISDNINQQEQQEILDQIFEDELKLLEQQNISSKNNLYRELEIFEDNNGLSENSLYSKINKTTTVFGDFKLKLLLKDLMTNRELLLHRQNILKKILADHKNFNLINQQLQQLSVNQLDILWLWKKKSIETENYLNQVYFKGPMVELLNKNEMILKVYSFYQIIASPMMNILTPLICIIIPYLLVRFCTPRKVDLKDYFSFLNFSLKGNQYLNDERSLKYAQYFSILIWFFYYLYTIYSNINAAMGVNSIINIIHSKINNIANFVKIAYEINCEYFNLFDCQKINRICENLWSNVFNQQPALLTDKGKILITYRELLEKKDDLVTILKYIGNVDSLMSIAKLFIQQSKLSNCFSFPEYVISERPIINVQSLWHPYLDNSKIVTNDISIGGNNKQNILITGPNAGGKSTFLKSLCISILLAQTLGISCGQNITMTIFHYLESYLNIPDVKGKESLFEAEVKRSLEYINKLNSIPSNQFSFIIMDEIFNSTNPEEGISGGYSICKKISSYQNSISVITTHYKYLTLLEKETNNFINYKIPIERSSDNDIVYSYKLIKGISDQNIALEILRNKGFDYQLISEAQAICDKLCQAKKKIKQKRIKESKEKKKINPEENDQNNLENELYEEIKDEKNKENYLEN